MAVRKTRRLRSTRHRGGMNMNVNNGIALRRSGRVAAAAVSRTMKAQQNTQRRAQNKEKNIAEVTAKLNEELEPFMHDYQYSEGFAAYFEERANDPTATLQELVNIRERYKDIVENAKAKVDRMVKKIKSLKDKYGAIPADIDAGIKQVKEIMSIISKKNSEMGRFIHMKRMSNKKPAAAPVTANSAMENAEMLPAQLNLEEESESEANNNLNINTMFKGLAL